jgi:hypothetical protein
MIPASVENFKGDQNFSMIKINSKKEMQQIVMTVIQEKMYKTEK